MKKVYKLLLVTLLFFIFSLNGNADEITNKKGDLRCNPDNKTSCEEIKNSNGEVIQVNVATDAIKNDGDIQVIKHVKKTNILGELEIWFTIKGKNIEIIQSGKDAYVIVVFDTSSTMNSGSQLESAKSAIKTFGKVLYSNKPEGVNYYLAAIQFAENSKIIRNFANKDFNDMSFSSRSSLGSKSELGYAYRDVYNLLAKVPIEDKKYVVLFGDGRYYNGYSCSVYPNKGKGNKYDTHCDVLDANYAKIRDSYKEYISIYGILYSGGSLHNVLYNKINKKKTVCYDKYRGDCDKMFMQKYTDTYLDARECNSKYSSCKKDPNYEDYFKEIAKIINSDKTYPVNISASLEDRIGSSFDIVGSSDKSKKITIKNIDENGVETEHFKIKINDNALDGWNDTNNSFNLTYDKKVISNNNNPQMYWKEIVCTDSITDEKEKVIKSCSGTESIDLEIKSNCQSEKKIYYDISCDEKITASIKINNLNDGVKKFSIDKGLGFPANLNLKTNLNCNYIFYKGLYDNDYNKLTREISKETDEKIIHSKTKKINEMKSYLETYNSYLNNLNDYKTNVFSNQTATLKVKVLDNSYDYQDFINSNFKINEDNCKDTETYQDGFKVTTKTCSLKMEKDMVLTEKCLNMKDGSVENCTNSNKQIKGGNKYYTSINKNSGSVFVEINSLGYTSVINNKSNISIKLEDCEYETGKLYKDKVSFRQIELSDPFLKSYTNSKRKIGKNYSNTRYDFVSIIKPDIWSLSTSDYKFSLSKINVSNIRHDTNNLGVSSYLGSDCYINNLNKYVCKFFEESKKNNFFTNIEK